MLAFTSILEHLGNVGLKARTERSLAVHRKQAKSSMGEVYGGLGRWHLFKALAAILCIGAAVWLALWYFIPAPPSTVTIASGIKGSSFEHNAHRYRERLARAHVTLDVRLTDGMLDSLRLLEDRSSGVDAAFVLGGITNTKQTPGLMSLGRISFQPIWLFYRGTETLDRLAQLKGKRIAVGIERGGLRVVANQILGASGVNPDSATLLPLIGPAAIKALKDGEVDVIFTILEPVVQSLLRDPTVRLMSLTQAEALTRVFPYLARLVLPQGVIDFERNIPASDVSLIATTVAVVVRNDLHPELVYLLAQTLSEEHSAAGIFQRAGDFPTQTDPEFVVAEEAREFYRNGPSFLQRYLPFWMITFAKRMIAVLLTAIAIITPLITFGSKLFDWLVRDCIRYVSRRLRVVETSLQTELTAPQVAALKADLENFERAANILGVGSPMRSSELLFDLKNQVGLMREHLGSRLTKLRSQMSKSG